ncbi:CHAT domain-containing protein [Bacteroidota bacterium]
MDLYERAYKCAEKAEYDSAVSYYLEAISIQSALVGHYDKFTGYLYHNLGVVYKKLYHLKKALTTLNTSEEILEDIDSESFFLSYIYNNKANIFYTYSDYAEAEIYYRNSLNHLINLNAIDNESFGTITLNLFNVIIAQNRLEEAKKLISDIKEINVTGSNAYTKHMFLAQAYDIFGEIELAYKEFELAKETLESLDIINPLDRIELNFRLASLLLKEKKLEKSNEVLIENLQLFQELKAIDFKKLAETYLLIGEIQLSKKDYKNAYKWLTESITKLQNKLTEANLDSNTNSSKILSNIFIDLKHLLAKVCQVLYEENNNIYYLQQSLDLYSEIIEDFKIFRLHMKNEDSKLQNTEFRISFLKEAINLAFRFYEFTGDNKYIDLAFYYAENTKSFVLLSEIKSVEAMQFADLPKEILEQEASLSNEITAYEEFIYDEKTSLFPDSSKLLTLNTKLFHLSDDYHNLLDSLEANYPKYFNLKYNPNFITPSEVQKNLSHKEALVEYVLYDTILTTFVIDKENIHVLSQNLEPGFGEKCFAYYSLLQNQDFSKGVHETYKEYVQLGRMFYETLVAPVLEVTKSREITFVPDGEIMYLPFESFVTKDVDNEYINYMQLPYLIYDLSVGYSYSSTMLFSPRLRHKIPKNKVLAFAPSYTSLLNADDSLMRDRQVMPTFLLPLPGANQEVSYISKTVPSDIYIDSAASEGTFKAKASDYSILHLAMHTIMNDEEPMFSKLAFTRNANDTTEDDDLFTYEIYNMKLNAEMVVLSSCSSGYGRMQKGEGMMSMARGFIYAGCPSIVMTLWQVSDKSSSELMSNFYRHLRKGKSKKKSLRQAKIDYIETSDNLKSNPYFWSAFMVVGDNSPLYRRNAGIYLGIFLFAFVLITVGITYKKQIKAFVKKSK